MRGTPWQSVGRECGDRSVFLPMRSLCTDLACISFLALLQGVRSICKTRNQFIVCKNDDDVTHNVFSQTSGFEFNSKTQAPGAEASVSFDKAGTVEVRCAIHPQMKAIVHVQ
jgi:hypothetical protein